MNLLVYFQFNHSQCSARIGNHQIDTFGGSICKIIDCEYTQTAYNKNVLKYLY